MSTASESNITTMVAAQSDSVSYKTTSYDACIELLQSENEPITAPDDADGLWCNATWDTFLCWPATPAGEYAERPCPSFKGFDTSRQLYKHCHSSGWWAWRQPNQVNYNRTAGFTNFESCMTRHIIDMLNQLGPDALQAAQQIAANTRILEFIGLAFSAITLVLSVIIFCGFRRLHVFRIQMHMQLCIAILAMVFIRLILYIDLGFTPHAGSDSGTITTINSTPYLCESFYFMLEYFKTVAFAWMFLEGFYLHNKLVTTVFDEEPKMWHYTMLSYGVPLIHCSIWLVSVRLLRGKIEKCIGNYYLHPEYWVLDGPRMLELIINFVFLLKVLRVLWIKVQESLHPTETEKLRKSTKAALLLIPLLGLPNILQIIPFTPTKHNLRWFEIFTYCAAFMYMFQGGMIAVLYCFTNREVISVVKQAWSRRQLQQSTAFELQRGDTRHSLFQKSHKSKTESRSRKSLPARSANTNNSAVPAGHANNDLSRQPILEVPERPKRETRSLTENKLHFTVDNVEFMDGDPV